MNNPFVLNLQICRKLTGKRKNYLLEHYFYMKGFTHIKKAVTSNKVFAVELFIIWEEALFAGT